MRRHSSILVFLVGFIAGCSSGNGVDMAPMSSTLDLAAPLVSGDMMQRGCFGIFECVQGGTAQTTCVAEGTTPGAALYDSLMSCLQTTCNGVSSTSSDPCLRSDDACRQCALSGTATTDMGTVDGGDCTAQAGGGVQTSSVCASCIPAAYACQLDT